MTSRSDLRPVRCVQQQVPGGDDGWQLENSRHRHTPDVVSTCGLSTHGRGTGKRSVCRPLCMANVTASPCLLRRPRVSSAAGEQRGRRGKHAASRHHSAYRCHVNHNHRNDQDNGRTPPTSVSCLVSIDEESNIEIIVRSPAVNPSGSRLKEARVLLQLKYCNLTPVLRRCLPLYNDGAFWYFYF